MKVKEITKSLINVRLHVGENKNSANLKFLGYTRDIPAQYDECEIIDIEPKAYINSIDVWAK